MKITSNVNGSNDCPATSQDITTAKKKFGKYKDQFKGKITKNNENKSQLMRLTCQENSTTFETQNFMLTLCLQKRWHS